jgi:hypothetical protein
MKKIALSLAGVLAAVAFAPEASAVPVFARQTGMACTACHFQHFPLLNGFGRAFKAAGYTMMGSQEKVEGEKLSLPDRVNMGVFTTTYYQNEDSGKTDGNKNPRSADHWGVPGTGGELSLFIGGRISDNAGFLMEAGLGGGGPSHISSVADLAAAIAAGSGGSISAPGGGIVGAAKLAILYPVGDARVGAVIHSSTGQGVAYSFELLNTGAANTHKMMGNGGPGDQHVRAAYAAQYLHTATSATGVSLVANNDKGFIVVGAYEMAGNDAVGGASSLGLTYVRAAAIMEANGWDVGFGLQNFGGKSATTGPLYGAVNNSPKATIIDVQAQGEVVELPIGLYASYGTAPAGTANDINVLNPDGGLGGDAATSFNLAAEIGIIPHTSTLQVAYRNAKNGATSNNADNALMLGVTYEIEQNIGLSYTHTSQFGSAWNTVATATGTEAPAGRTADTLLLEVLF